MSDNLDEPENNEVSFADEVDAALDNLKLPEQVAGDGGLVDYITVESTDPVQDDTAAQFVTNEAGDLQLDTDKRRTVLLIDDERGVSPLRNHLQEWKDAEAEHIKEAVGEYSDEAHQHGLDTCPVPNLQIEDFGRQDAPYIPQGNPFSIPFDESPAKTPPEATVAAFSHEGFSHYLQGYLTAIRDLQEKLDEMNDIDMIAILFQHHLDGDPVSKRVAETVAWANHVDVSDGALIPKDNEPAGTFAPQVLDMDTEKRQLDLGRMGEPGDDVLMGKEKATRADYSAFEREELELMLSEALAVNEAAQQKQQRDDQLPGLWAAITDYFNGVMSDQPESQLDEPLVIRIQLYNERLRNEAWQHQNANHLNEPDFYELPPILADFLINQPEDSYSLLPGHKLVNLIIRYKNGFEAAQRAANILNAIPEANGYDEMIDKLKEVIEDAAMWHTSKNT